MHGKFAETGATSWAPGEACHASSAQSLVHRNFNLLD